MARNKGGERVVRVEVRKTRSGIVVSSYGVRGSHRSLLETHTIHSAGGVQAVRQAVLELLEQ